LQGIREKQPPKGRGRPKKGNGKDFDTHSQASNLSRVSRYSYSLRPLQHRENSFMSQVPVRETSQKPERRKSSIHTPVKS
jgi:hypothetical protein